MKKINKKQKLIILISIATIIVIIGLIVGINAIRTNMANRMYNSSNGSSSNGNLLPEYIKEGITLGGVTGTLKDLDTSDATATPEDILYGKTAYVDGKKIIGTKPRTIDILEVGDYVAYTPDTTQTSYFLSSSYSGYSSDQTLYQESLNWRVLSINDDGTVDLISSQPTSEIICFGNAVGYNNGVFLLNDISTKLYSNNSLDATARSLTIEDIENHMTSEGLEYVHTCSNSIATWGETETYTYSSYIYYPNLYAEENGSGINTTDVKTNGIGQSDSYYTKPTTQSASKASTSLTVTQTYYNRSMSSNYYDNSTFYNLIHNAGKIYWLASRYVYTSSFFADFGIRYVKDSNLNCDNLFLSGNTSYNHEYSFRPVVSLKSNIKLGSGDGKSVDTAYQIIG